MTRDPWHYPRTDLADQYLKTLDIGLIKSLALFAQRRMGKTEFLRKDLVPAAEQAGYITIYVSLWESREDPEAVLLDAIQKAAEGEGIIPDIRRRLGRPGSKIGVGANAGTVGAQASWEQGTAEARSCVEIFGAEFQKIPWRSVDALRVPSHTVQVIAGSSPISGVSRRKPYPKFF
jgi:hypothetical protein